MPGTDQFRYLDDPRGPADLGAEDRARIRALGLRRRRQRQAFVALPVLALAVAAIAVPLALPDRSGPSRLTVAPPPSSSPAPTTQAPTTSAPAPSASSTPVASSPAPPLPTTSAAPGPVACRTAGLHVSFGPTQGAAGSIITEVHLTNTGTAPCTLFGYPGISFLDAAGNQVGAPATRDQRPAATVTLNPGGVASANLSVAEAANYPPELCAPKPAVTLRIFPPGETAATIVAAKGGSVQICSRTSQGAGGQQVHVTPLTPLGG